MRVVNRLIACAAAVAALAIGATWARAQSGNLIATPARVAMLTIPGPRSPDDIFLDVWIEAYRPPQRGAVEAIVSIAQASGGALEVGRFTVFPNVPFTAAGPQELRAYRFDASAALAKLRPGGTAVTVSVALMPNDEKISAQGSEIKLNKAEFSPRP